METQHGPTNKLRGRCATCGGRLAARPAQGILWHVDFTLEEAHRLHAAIRNGDTPHGARARALGITTFSGGAQTRRSPIPEYVPNTVLEATA